MEQIASKVSCTVLIPILLMLGVKFETYTGTAMRRVLQIVALLLSLMSFGFFYGITMKRRDLKYSHLLFSNLTSTQIVTEMNYIIFQEPTNTTFQSMKPTIPEQTTQKNFVMTMSISSVTNKVSTDQKNTLFDYVTPSYILRQGNGIIFLESGNRMPPPSLVLCALESAARVYPDRPIVFFVSGISDIKTKYDEENVRSKFPTLSSFPNVYIFPLKLEEVFKDTPLLNWLQKIDRTRERHWIHVSSDGCRLALIWKYGGIYMDTDIISIRPIPDTIFLAAQYSQDSSNGVFGLPTWHYFTWNAMEDFVKNYRGDVWGYQGPGLFTRVLKKYCDVPKFNGNEDILCGNISFLNPQRYYPIPYPQWRKYYQVWKQLPTFNESYSLHLWNTMNKGQMSMIPGDNTLVEHLYHRHCPTTYTVLAINKSRHKH